MDTVSTELGIMLFRVRDRVRGALEREDMWEMGASKKAHARLFCQLYNWFPKSKKKEIRLGLLMALVGFSVASQSELNQETVHILIEVTNGNSVHSPKPSAYLTPKLSAELEALVESKVDGSAWEIPVCSPESLAVPNL